MINRLKRYLYTLCSGKMGEVGEDWFEDIQDGVRKRLR
jgi:hypothetical protein